MSWPLNIVLQWTLGCMWYFFFFFELWLSQGVCPVVGLLDYMVETGATCGSVGKESACNAGDAGSIPGWGRCPGGGHGNPLQYPCLENPTDRGAWRAAVHRVTKSRTRLKQLIGTWSITHMIETWIDLESVIQSEVSLKEKKKYCILYRIMCGI